LVKSLVVVVPRDARQHRQKEVLEGAAHLRKTTLALFASITEKVEVKKELEHLGGVVQVAEVAGQEVPVKALQEDIMRIVLFIQLEEFGDDGEEDISDLLLDGSAAAFDVVEVVGQFSLVLLQLAEEGQQSDANGGVCELD